jgi:hypothetical protein
MSSARNVARLEKEFMRKRTLKQRFKEWLFDDGPDASPNEIRIDEDSIQISRETSVRFEIHQAAGGRVVQTRRYDRQKDRHAEGLYIITPDQDFGREIDKIITMESLKS